MTAEVTAASPKAAGSTYTSGSLKANEPGTEYVILERAALGVGGMGWAEFARETARSAEAAIKAALEGNKDGGTYVAISARSFKPFTVTPQTVTTLKLEASPSTSGLS